MSSELRGIIILGVLGTVGIGVLVHARRDVKEQIKRTMALETMFQKWNAEKLDSLSQRFDQVLEMLRRGEI